jgi:hypothetical protein
MRAKRPRSAAPRPAADTTLPDLEVVLDPTVAPGDVLPPLARLLRSLAERDRSQSPPPKTEISDA